MPELEGIDIVAHSRGTDVVTTALRELELELRGSGSHVTDAFKFDGGFVHPVPSTFS